MPAIQTLHTEVQRYWQSLAARERRLLLTATAVIGLALLWWVGLSPALNTLHHAELRQRELDTQWQQMQGLQAQAHELLKQTRLPRSEVVQALEASVRQRLGSAGQLSIQGDRATLALKAVPAEALAQWLVQARVNARVLPSEMRLNRSPVSAAKSGDDQAEVSWDGTLSLTLPSPDAPRP